ncbi:di-heme oxidoredictase family protein [Methylotuvimicrobium sp. KM1]|uniref:di-heme oxidoredictase family protein n=1 Tax=Methylotuvimicrobium sp. KM1 TaxID=3377707 RepID=UPI00384A66E3
MMRIQFVVFMMSCLTAYDAVAKQTLTVLTAYHEEVVAQFETAFERVHPDIDVKIIWRMPHDALPYLRQPEQGGVDVYWSASLHNFLQLKQEGVWQKLKLDRSGLPEKLGAMPLADPDGFYRASEMAGYGFVVNPGYLQKHALPQPNTWLDLADARYGGHIALPVPSRFGFAPLMIDSVLQQYGWGRGWALAPDTLFSPRIGPPVFGLGLLEAVAYDTIRQLAERSRNQGLNGRPNIVWDSERKRKVIGRFGLKANVATLKQQITGAFIGDMGITSSLHPNENCSSVQIACQQAPSARQPELDDTQLGAVLTYLRLLQVPAQRNAGDSGVRQGERLFAEIGCANCHTPTVRTGNFSELPALSNQSIHPYTDLLLHDMGEGLADGRPDFEAGGRDWRTPPLWGIGLVERINGHTFFLHDGRARNLMEAVLWHGGEARLARQHFERLSSDERWHVVRFLESL